MERTEAFGVEAKSMQQFQLKQNYLPQHTVPTSIEYSQKSLSIIRYYHEEEKKSTSIDEFPKCPMDTNNFFRKVYPDSELLKLFGLRTNKLLFVGCINCIVTMKIALTPAKRSGRLENFRERLVFKHFLQVDYYLRGKSNLGTIVRNELVSHSPPYVNQN